MFEAQPTYGDYLHAIARRGPFPLRLGLVVLNFVVLWQRSGLEIACIDVAALLVGCLSVGFPIWKAWKASHPQLPPIGGHR